MKSQQSTQISVTRKRFPVIISQTTNISRNQRRTLMQFCTPQVIHVSLLPVHLKNSKIRHDSQITLHQRYLTFISFQLCKVGNPICFHHRWAGFRPSTVSLFILCDGCLVGLCYFWRSRNRIPDGLSPVKFDMHSNSGVCNRLCWQLSECCCHEIKLMVEWLPHDLSTLASPDDWSERIKIWLSVKQKTEWKEIAEPYHRNVWETSVELLLNELMKSCLCSAARWSA